MANTLTNLIPAMTEAMDVVSREMVGMIPAVRRDSNVARVALNQNVYIPITPEASTATNSPGVTAPDTGDQTIDNTSITISKSKHVAVRWNGEETKGLQNSGLFSSIQAQRFYQGIRALVNEIEADLWGAAYIKASRAYGTAGTAPFGPPPICRTSRASLASSTKTARRPRIASPCLAMPPSRTFAASSPACSRSMKRVPRTCCATA